MHFTLAELGALANFALVKTKQIVSRHYVIFESHFVNCIAFAGEFGERLADKRRVLTSI